jgi:hypothetical protein
MSSTKKTSSSNRPGKRPAAAHFHSETNDVEGSAELDSRSDGAFHLAGHGTVPTRDLPPDMKFPVYSGIPMPRRRSRYLQLLDMQDGECAQFFTKSDKTAAIEFLQYRGIACRSQKWMGPPPGISSPPAGGYMVWRGTPKS